jgi:hypothetical protein
MRCKQVFKFGFFFLGLFFYGIVLAAPTVSVTPASQTVNPGQNATVKIVTTSASKCSITGDTYNKNNIILNGNILLSPTKSVTYNFTCTDSSGIASSTTASVNILARVVNAPVTTSPNTPNTSNSNTGNSLGQATRSQAPQIQYGNQTTQTEADAICAAYSGYQSVYSTPSAGGGSSVPVDLTALRPYLISIDQNSRLTANEMRQADLIRFCRILPNIAAASAKLAQETAKELKTLADSCTADEKCYAKRIYDYDVQREITLASKIPDADISRSVQKQILKLNTSSSTPVKNYNYDLVNYCNGQFDKGRMPIECINIPHNEDIIKEQVYDAQNRIKTGQIKIATEFANGQGVIGSRPCTKTFSGNDPTNVFYRDPDCADYKTQPALINQEVLKQITALPYTTAYSQASELGVDQTINNINTRIRNGNLVDSDISTNFGSVSSGGSNPLGSSGGAITSGTDMKTVEPNYNKIISNIKVITTLYDVGKAAYASSTSACKAVPVESRALTIQRIDDAKKSYTDYAADLTTKWTNAVKTPNENHLPLVTQINFDLKDKYNQDLINKVYDAVKALLQTCVDANSRNTTN